MSKTNTLFDKIEANGIKIQEEFIGKQNSETFSYIVDEDDNSGVYNIDIFSNNKQIMSVEGKMIGIFNILLGAWYWGWVIDYVNNKMIIQKNVIDNFKTKIKAEYKNNISSHNSNDMMYYYCNNDIIHTQNDKKLLSILSWIILHLTKGLGIIQIPFGLGLTPITDKNKKNARIIGLFVITKINQMK